jgi:hypothetical protein
LDQPQTHAGKCFCGAVELAATGSPMIMGYCHCASCREWSAAPINAFTIWKPENVKVTKGADNLGVFHRTDRSYRKWCKTCGGHVFTEHPHGGYIDVYAAIIPTMPFKAALHVHYQETVLHVKDGLPKMKELPKEFGGSGTTMPE